MRLLAIAPIAFLIPSFLAPFFVVIYRSVANDGFSLGAYYEIFSNEVYLTVLLQTFKTAAVATLIALFLGFPIAHVITTSSPFWAGISFACVMIPLWTSAITRTYAWIALLGRKGFANQLLLDFGLVERPLSLMYNFTTVQIGMVQVLLPLMILPLVSSMRQMDKTKIMAAEILGANPVRAFLHAYVPMCLPGVLAGSTLVFITALGYYVTPALLGGEKDMMITVLIEQQVSKTLNWQLASALATILLVIVLLLLWLIGFVARNRGVKLEVS